MQKNDFNKCVFLFRKYYSGELSDPEKEELENILKDRNLERVFRSLNEGVRVSEKLEEYRQFDAGLAFLEFRRQQETIKDRKIRRRFAAAAAVVLFLLGAAWLLNRHLPEVQPLQLVQDEQLIQPGRHKAILRLANGGTVNFDRDSMDIQEKNGTRIQYADGKITYQHTSETVGSAYNELIVPAAGECYITLEDNTKVWINADSRLRYPVRFSGTERKVHLEGEAYFDVAKDGRAFQVVTSRGEVAVLGTAFGISAYTGKTEYTTLVRGSVRYTNKRQESVVLAPGEQAVVGPEGELYCRKVEVEEYVGWKDGLFIFRDKPLEEIMEILTRWYGTEVVFGNEEVKQLKYTGNLERYESINAFLQVLERLEDVHYEINDNTIVLSRKK